MNGTGSFWPFSLGIALAGLVRLAFMRGLFRRPTLQPQPVKGAETPEKS